MGHEYINKNAPVTRAIARSILTLTNNFHVQSACFIYKRERKRNSGLGRN